MLTLRPTLEAEHCSSRLTFVDAAVPYPAFLFRSEDWNPVAEVLK